jgi:hypothetical protein
MMATEVIGKDIEQTARLCDYFILFAGVQEAYLFPFPAFLAVQDQEA